MKPKWLNVAGTSKAADVQRRRRITLRKMTAGKCFYCGGPTFDRHHPNARDWLLPGPGYEMVREHIVPVSRGGALTAENTVPACSGCNNEKGPFTAAEFRTLRGLRRGDLNHQFTFEADRPRRDWIVVHSEPFERSLMEASHPASVAAFALRRRRSWADRRKSE
jgi:hypothetical protein